ncbi:MAG: hypothetical protein COX81_00490 [Candidatus Magasanikbacteria bacterium CG_4_10_14_0_2_um_filter_37_12]|uniref:Membrane insertase YidC/Oxa/ALB C-terminal domain-containing protein n=1 Tax=Candidatus Magasanikbacteria bacterium CG_4_10_14_0_2_um_filter_37_12 TaxID=1974637 RepID=A0A2M7V9S5_9BACT|nr:MAG: hypothetical protein COX81_00490 [Candidatus Magasanikbacteria bacterium CG_4_10_14_0_2_um_filter_37_12]
MQALFQTILYQPIFNVFVGLYNLIPDVGITIFILTVVIKMALFPMTNKSIKAQKDMQDLQPKMEKVKQDHKGDQQRIAQETMKLYKEHKVNPLGSCLPLLIQLPIFIALYYVLRDGLANQHFDLLYSFVTNPGEISPMTLGLFDLSHRSVILAVLAAGAQFWQSKRMMTKKPPKNAGAGAKDEKMSTMMSQQMTYFMPFITLVIGIQFPGGLTLYWFLSTLLMAIQQEIIFRKKGPDDGKGIIEGEVVK